MYYSQWVLPPDHRDHITVLECLCKLSRGRSEEVAMVTNQGYLGAFGQKVKRYKYIKRR